jgi:type IV secretory pathway VirD2 relaxase
MPKRLVDLRSAEPLLDIASYGRRGPGHRPALTGAAVAHASRTARRVPEVMIKVSGGARTVRGVASHLDYIGREGKGDIETDEGTLIHEQDFERTLLKDWDLELDERRRHTQRGIAAGRKPTKLVHNLVFSMPTGTPPGKLYKAVQKFATEKFALQHRYAMALHTDQGHPHVHVVVKAMSEEGKRLNIYKATLREWRQDFARCLREFGVEANATDRAVRGAHRQTRKDGIHRAAMRGASIFMRDRVESVARELRDGGLRPETGKARLRQTREEVERGWLAFADAAVYHGMRDVAEQIRRFVATMSPVRTDREWIAAGLHRHRQNRPRQQLPTTR